MTRTALLPASDAVRRATVEAYRRGRITESTAIDQLVRAAGLTLPAAMRELREKN